MKLKATSKNGNAYTIEKGGTAAAPTTVRKCTTVGKGACPSTGDW